MINESEKRLHRVCFTGHRPEKLNQPEEVIIEKLEMAIRQAIADGVNNPRLKSRACKSPY